MNHLMGCASVALAMVVAPAAQSFTAERLANDLQVVFVPRPELPIVTYALYLRGGLSVDTPQTFRHASLTMGCMWMGFGDLDEDAARAALADIGGEAHSAVDLQDTRVQLSCLAPFAEQGLELFCRALFTPTYPEAIVAREVRRERDALAWRSKQPEYLAQEALMRSLCGNHPLATLHTVRDVAGTLQQVDRTALLAAHRRMVQPQLGTLFVLGPLDDTLRDRVRTRLVGWPRTARDLGTPPPPTQLPRIAPLPQDAPRVVKVALPEMTDVYLQMGTLGPDPREALWAPSHLFRLAMAGGFTSRLQDELRTNRGLVYGLSFSQPSLSIPAPTSITTRTRPDKVVELLDVTCALLRRTLAGDLPQPMVDAARNLWLGNRAIDRESQLGFANALHAGYRLFGDLDGYAREIEAVRSAELAAVLAAGQRFAPEQFVVVMVGSAENLAKIDWRLPDK